MNKFLKNYWFILSMLVAIVAGCIVGAVWPGATALEPLGTVFINLMFCVVVPMVFCSIASAIANMASIKRAGKVLGTTVVTFLVTAAIAAVCGDKGGEEAEEADGRIVGDELDDLHQHIGYVREELRRHGLGAAAHLHAEAEEDARDDERQDGFAAPKLGEVGLGEEVDDEVRDIDLTGLRLLEARLGRINGDDADDHIH